MAAPGMALGVKPREMSPLYRETGWSRIRGELCGNFQILIVSAVTMSAYRLSFWGTELPGP